MPRLLALTVTLIVCSSAASWALVCTTPARSGCLVGTLPASSVLRMNGSANKSRLVFKWRRGQETMTSDFGDPFATTTYAVCTYDGSRTILHSENVVEPEPCFSSGPMPCWRATRTGFRYRHTDPFGRSTKVVLQAGADGRAAVGYNSSFADVLAGTGSTVTLPLVVQLQATDGGCFEAVFSSATQNTPTGLFKAKSD
jgi:hypothetical protein